MALGLMMLRCVVLHTPREMNSPAPRRGLVLSAALPWRDGAAAGLRFDQQRLSPPRLRYVREPAVVPAGVVMLAAFVWCSVFYAGVPGQDISPWDVDPSASNLFCCPMTDALAVRWWAGGWPSPAEDDLAAYLSMRGNIISREEFQRKNGSWGCRAPQLEDGRFKRIMWGGVRKVRLLFAREVRRQNSPHTLPEARGNDKIQ